MRSEHQFATIPGDVDVSDPPGAVEPAVKREVSTMPVPRSVAAPATFSVPYDREAAQQQARDAAAEIERGQFRNRVGQLIADLYDTPRDELRDRLKRSLAGDRGRDTPSVTTVALRTLLPDAVPAELLAEYDAGVADRETATRARRPALGLRCPVVARRRFRLGEREIQVNEAVDLGDHYWPPGRLAKLLDNGFVVAQPAHLDAVDVAVALNAGAARPAPDRPKTTTPRRRAQTTKAK